MTEVALALVVVPLLFALLAMAVPERGRPWVLLVAAASQLGLVGYALWLRDVGGLGGWLLLDGMGRLVLAFTTLLFFLCAIYAIGYLAHHPARSNRTFIACLLAFMAMMTLMIEAQHLGLMWVALETLTLASAPLVYFEQGPRALEATWKYLLIGSVGIALALLGSLFLAYSALRGGVAPSLLQADLVADAPRLSSPWLRSAFVILFIGYGTKMGLAPMHTWKPDAYGEAPGVVGALLAGGVTSCAFMAILRFFRICAAAGDATFARHLMVVIGLLSMAVAGAFLARQKDFKRMLAYSSVEHMGILVLGTGIGGAALFGAMLHLVNNALTKGVLFLSAGNIQRAYGSKSTDEVRGALRRVPISAGLLLAGFFAVTGSPPFGPFVSEFTILNATVSGGHWLVAALFLSTLAVVFVGMGATVLAVVQGAPPEAKAVAAPSRGDRFSVVAPAVVLLGLVVLLGVYIPKPVSDLLHGAVAAVQVAP